MQDLSIAQLWYWMILMAIVCYFIGCFNFAVLISRKKHKDVRTLGSGNPGTMNMSREFGLKTGIITLACDLFKGGIPVVIAYFVFRNYVFTGTNVVVSDFMRYFCGLWVVVGHIYPVTMKFHGGKGIASTAGVFWFGISCEAWWVAPVYFIIMASCVFGYIYFTEWGSMGSLFAVAFGTVIQALIFYFRYSGELVNAWIILIMCLLFALNVLTWFAHRVNIIRLLSGEEHRTSIKKLAHKKS